MHNQIDNTTPTPVPDVVPSLRPFIVHFVPGSADELPDNDFYLQCGHHQRKIVVFEHSPEEALGAATRIIDHAYPHKYLITRIDDETSLRDSLAVFNKANSGELAPASNEEDFDEWDRFDEVVHGS